MVVDNGVGTIRVKLLLSLNGVVYSSPCAIGGDRFDELSSTMCAVILKV